MYSKWLLELNREDAEDVAERIRSNDNWNIEDCEELCRLAGMQDEWEQDHEEDGYHNTFESVVYKAAEMLGVEI